MLPSQSGAPDHAPTPSHKNAPPPPRRAPGAPLTPCNRERSLGEAEDDAEVPPAQPRKRGRPRGVAHQNSNVGARRITGGAALSVVTGQGPDALRLRLRLRRRKSQRRHRSRLLARSRRRAARRHEISGSATRQRAYQSLRVCATVPSESVEHLVVSWKTRGDLARQARPRVDFTGKPTLHRALPCSQEKVDREQARVAPRTRLAARRAQPVRPPPVRPCVAPPPAAPLCRLRFLHAGSRVCRHHQGGHAARVQGRRRRLHLGQ